MLLKSLGLQVSALVVAACVAVIAPAAPAAAQDGGPFEGMNGSWNGTGTITLASGSRERIRCLGNYRAASNTLGLDLRCASDSYKFELSGNATSNGGSLSGNWFEKTRSVAGNISGRAAGGNIQARADGQVFTALLNITTKAGKQSITITSPGSDLSSVVITMAKR